MFNYVKLLKVILTNRRKFEEFKVVALNEERSALLQNKVPLNEKYLDSFTIPISTKGKKLGQALCDLGSSINLMSLSIYQKLGFGEARSTKAILQPTDRSFTHLKAKIEMDKFIFSSDFIILDYEANHDVPIILERPFLKTE
ncbi:uncharacterized protein LOC111786855 [Cucurbita pepo subsp. pepo]|uniref:uncharacterized protein LOC111786855 n=1 Tax=Cucurbita pepo subsp. pepo TaxID=3664 RepID=UPI000C9D7A38|nr:uncharacterized protein LOC111786855 [Cucurbita pepo subsp. pepo]